MVRFSILSKRLHENITHSRYSFGYWDLSVCLTNRVFGVFTHRNKWHPIKLPICLIWATCLHCEKRVFGSVNEALLCKPHMPSFLSLSHPLNNLLETLHSLMSVQRHCRVVCATRRQKAALIPVCLANLSSETETTGQFRASIYAWKLFWIPKGITGLSPEQTSSSPVKEQSESVSSLHPSFCVLQC